jgi:N-methylhydantoinase A/acetophenone carboxylase
VSARIGVDVGGTFTDVFVALNGRVARGKADTTHYDLRVGFMNAVRVAAERLGSSLEALVPQADSIVYSTTVGTNALLERKGPRLGLITTWGFEGTVHLGRARNWADGLPPERQYDRGRARRPIPLIPRELIVGVHERIDSRGTVLMPINDAEITETIQRLVDQGVRGFVVVLLNSFVNPVHEQRVRELIRELYPEGYLGHMPVLLSSEVSPQIGEYRRSMTAILDGYLRVAAEDHLLALSDDLRDMGYRKPLFIAKATGGVSSLSRTRPIHLFGSGPVAGILGTHSLCSTYGIRNALVTDMGGTSFDVGLIVEGEHRIYDLDPVIDRWRVQVPIVAHWSIGAGGGSIARVEDGMLKVGPESAGSFPGPVCYARGGKEPTVTDADTVLGYIDPEYFLGGRISLDREAAADAIRTKVAEPLAKSVEEAAWMVKEFIDAVMGQEMYRITALKSGLDPRDFVLFALGGAGPLHAAGYGRYADVARVAIPPLGSVSGAFGALTMDLLQTYEKSTRVTLYYPNSQTVNRDVIPAINAEVDDLLALARRDMEEERLDLSRVALQLHLGMQFGLQRHSLLVPSPKLRLDDENDIAGLRDRFMEAYAEAYGRGSVFSEAGVEVVLLRLSAAGPLPKPAFGGVSGSASLPSAQKGSRKVYWSPAEGWVETPVYRRELLPADAVVEGPAIIEFDDTTAAVPPTWRYRLDSSFLDWMEARKPDGEEDG